MYEGILLCIAGHSIVLNDVWIRLMNAVLDCIWIKFRSTVESTSVWFSYARKLTVHLSCENSDRIKEYYRYVSDEEVQ